MPNNLLLRALVFPSNRHNSCGPNCFVREDSGIPDAFAPKGRYDAAILQAFRLLTCNTGTKFSSRFISRLSCVHCGWLGNCSIMMNPIIEYDFNTNCNFLGSLPDGISHLIDNDAQTQMANNLRCGCGSFLTPHAAHFKMPDFFVNLGLTGKNARNEQKSHIVVPQEMRLKGEQYFLAGAMQMGLTADHFLAIVNHCSAYVVLDDLDNNVMMYPTFAAAVSRQLTDSSRAKS